MRLSLANFGGLFLVGISLILHTSLIPPPPPTTYYSIGPGDFESTAIWSTTGHDGSSCSCSPGCTVGNNETVRVKHEITSTCDPLTVSGGGHLIIDAAGKLSVSGNVSISGTGDLDILEDGTLTASDDVNISGNGDLIVDGLLEVGGDVNLSGSGTACGTGTASITGTITGSGWCSGITVLPIELIDFNASYNVESGEVELDWQTAAEINNDYFLIERSANGFTFEEVLQLDGAGTSKSELAYNGADPDPLPGLSYYRLTQFDYNGDHESFDLVAVNINKKNESDCVLEINPNPCVPFCTALLSDCPEGQAVVQVVDISGNRVRQKLGENSSNSPYQFKINKDNNLMPGIYVVRAQSGSEQSSKKIIVK